METPASSVETRLLEPFTFPFVQEAIIEILLLSVAAGLAGTWIVLRGLSFYSHAVGTASFPGLVLADGLGFSATLGAFGMAAAFTGISALISRSRRTGSDSVTALALVASLAAGVILASDVFGSGANIDSLLFGSLLAIGPGDQLLAAAAAIVAVVSTRLFSARWLARGFDAETASSLRSGSAWLDLALLGVVAFTVTAALSAVGALLVAALIVVPAATVRLVTRTIPAMQAGAVILAAIEGIFGLWLSVKTDAPPGATVAVVSGVAFIVVLAGKSFRRSRPAALAVAVLGLTILVTGCGDGPGTGEDGRIDVAATTTQVADLVGEVGGDRVDVDGILQPNSDPHEYEPRPSDVVAVSGATVVFRSGGDIDQWAETLIDESGSDARAVDLEAAVPVRLHGGHAHGEASGGGPDGGDEIDPHWWHDPVNVRAAVSSIEAALAAADPAGERRYRANASALDAEVASLDRSIAACFASLPRSERVIVTEHDSFGYFANRYGITVAGTVVPALTTEAQPSAGDLAELEQTIGNQDVSAVFSENSAPDKLPDAIASDTGVTDGGALYGDSLGPVGSDASTWVGMMHKNADTVMSALTRGRRGCGFE